MYINTFTTFFTDELDSYMYQTVGHMGIEKLAEAMELPLYRRTTSGNTTQKGKTYEPMDDQDEVEDLFLLLKQVKVKKDIFYSNLRINNLFRKHRRRKISKPYPSEQFSRTTNVFDVKMCKLLNF